MTMRKLLAVLATLAIMCAVLPLGSLFSAVADGNVIEDTNFDDGELHGWSSSSVVSVEDGALKFECTKDWANVYKYANGMKANTDYVYTFRAKANMNSTMNIKINDNWAADSAHVTFDVTTEWQEFTVNVNSGDFKSAAILMFSVNVPASSGMIFYLDYVTITEGSAEPETPDEPANDGNLIVNGDFETGDNSGWEIWQSTAIEAAAAKDGAYGAHLQGNGSWGGMLNQTATVEAGKQYKLSFWINVNATGVNVQVKDGAGAAIEGAGGWFDTNKKDKLVEWTFTATDDKVLINFCGSGSAPEDAYVDNFVLVCVENGDEPDAPEDDALVKNGGFETGDLTNWINLWDGCQVEFVEGYESTHAVKITAGGWSQVRQNMIPVEPNTDYVLSADYKYAENFALMIKKGDDSGDVASVMLESSSKWQKGTLEFNTGDLTAVCVLLIGWDGGGDAIIDNVVLAKKGEEPVEPDQPDVPSADILNATFDTDEFDGILSSSDISVADGALQFNVNKDWGNVYTELAVEANTDYQISFRAKSKLGKNVWVKFHKADWTGDIGQADATIGTDWADYTYTLNSGDNTSVWLLIQYNGYAAEGETIWFDYITVKKVGGSNPSTSDDLVKNGDFETGDNTGWDKHQGTVINADAAYKGQYGANLIGDGGWGGLLNQDVKVEAGETYIITLWVCPNTGGVNLQIKGATKIDEESDNTWMNSGELSGWTERTVVVVADSDTLTLNFCGGGNNVAADIYLDEIKVTKKGAAPEVEDTYPIKNAGFETGDLTSWNNLWGSCTVSFDTPGHDKSQYALNFQGPGAWNQVRQDGVPVEPNTDYTLIAYVKNPLNLNLVVKTADDKVNIADFGVENDFSNTWVRQEVSFNSGDQTSVCVLIISNGDGNGSAIVDNVQIYKKGEEPSEPEPDAPATEGPMQLDSYGTAINRPASEDANLIENGSFENAEGGQWQSVISDTLYVVDDETAPEGDKSLFFNTSGVKDNKKVIFYMDVEPNTDYVFSAWVKGAFISADNRFNATFGVTDWKDNFCVYQDAKFSNKTRQIVPTAWDNEWHLRSVQFNSGVNTKIGIGFAGAESQMWIDGIALYTVDNGIKYGHPRQIGHVMASSLELGEDGTTADENNLIAGSTMDTADAKEFWSGAEGYKNGFISFVENEYEYGASMKYTGDDKSCYTNAIKWLTVEPNTEYIFTVDMRVVKSGGGSLNLLDGKKRECDAFLMIDFDQYTYGNGWNNIAIKFNSGEFDRIGIAIVDGGGEALIDNMRLFKAADRVDGDDEYIEPPYSFDDPEEPTDPDSPATGVSVMGAVLAMALVPSSAAVALKLRRKKEDEE